MDGEHGEYRLYFTIILVPCQAWIWSAPRMWILAGSDFLKRVQSANVWLSANQIKQNNLGVFPEWLEVHE